MIWFTADTHFSHRNILRFCERPFPNIHEHDEALIKNWNECVSENDTVYHLGDFGYRASRKYLIGVVERLHGKIMLVKGSHDKKLVRGDLAAKFHAIHDYGVEVILDSQLIILCHYPIFKWCKSYYGSWQLHGHCHGKIEADNVGLCRMDVGVDVYNYRPISFEEVQRIMELKRSRKVLVQED
ncbi:MAG: phosphoesterase [Candidatus Paceibacterota bacterium]